MNTELLRQQLTLLEQYIIKNPHLPEGDKGALIQSITAILLYLNS